MKKLATIILLTLAVSANAEELRPSEKLTLLAKLCQSEATSKHKWGWLGDTGVACFSDRYAKRNGYALVNGTWVKR